MVRKISLAEFKNNVLLFPYLKKEDKTSEQFNFALDEIEKQNSIYIGKEKDHKREFSKIPGRSEPL